MNATEIAVEISPKTTKASPKPPKRLVTAVRRATAAKGDNDRVISDSMGITPAYWNALMNGHRPVSNLAYDKIKALALYLDMSVVEVMQLTEQLSAQDFMMPNNREKEFDRVLQVMRDDHRWSGLAPTDDVWITLPIDVKCTIAVLYQTASSQTLLRLANVYLPPSEKQTA